MISIVRSFFLLLCGLRTAIADVCSIFIDTSTANSDGVLNLGEVQLLDSNNNIIPATSATLSSTGHGWVASRCIDGNIETICHSNYRANDYLRIDYDNADDSFLNRLASIRIYNRQDGWQERIVGATIYVSCSDTPPATAAAASSTSLLTVAPSTPCVPPPNRQHRKKGRIEMFCFPSYS